MRPVLKAVVSKLKKHDSFFAGKHKKKVTAFESRLLGALKAAYRGGQRQFFADKIVESAIARRNRELSKFASIAGKYSPKILYKI